MKETVQGSLSKQLSLLKWQERNDPQHVSSHEGFQNSWSIPHSFLCVSNININLDLCINVVVCVIPFSTILLVYPYCFSMKSRDKAYFPFQAKSEWIEAPWEKPKIHQIKRSQFLKPFINLQDSSSPVLLSVISQKLKVKRHCFVFEGTLLLPV